MRKLTQQDKWAIFGDGTQCHSFQRTFCPCPGCPGVLFTPPEKKPGVKDVSSKELDNFTNMTITHSEECINLNSLLSMHINMNMII